MLNYIKQKLDSGTIEFLSHGKNYLNASILSKALLLISIPIMTRLLSPSDYGLLAVFTTLVSILGILFGLGVKGSISRYYYEKKDDFSAFFLTNSVFVFTMGCFIGFMVYLFREAIAEMMALPVLLVEFAIFIAIISSLYGPFQGYLQARKQSKVFAQISVLKAAVTLVFTVSFTLLLEKELYLGSVYSFVVIATIFFFFSAYVIKQIGIWDFSVKHLQYSLVFGFPIVVHLLSMFILNSSDQMMINAMVGSKETGIYTFAYKVAMIFQMLIIGLNQAWVPIFYERLRDEKYKEIQVTAVKYTYLITGAALLITISGPVLVRMLAPKEYAEAFTLVPIIVVGFLFQYFYMMYVNYAFYEKKTSTIAMITLFAGCINIGLNYWLIPIYGYVVAAWTTMITYVLFFIMHYLNVKYTIRNIKKIPLKVVLLPGLFVMVFIVASSLSSDYIEGVFGQFLVQTTLLFVYVVPILIKYKKRIETNKDNK